MVKPCIVDGEDSRYLADPYELESISLTPAPPGYSGSDWHRYEISQGDNRIVGFRVGTSDNVREAVAAIVAHLNQRRRTRRGRVDMLLHSNRTTGSP